tara:strand:+ start:145 stop:399 length:255 start_codon:yes stop_codon:yes gene_type:complete
MGVDDMTGDELNMTEAKLSRKMRAGDATPSEIQQYNMISKRMGNVNIPLDRQRMMVASANGFSVVTKKARRQRRKKNIKKNKKK